MFSRPVGREGHCRQISLACVGSTRSVPATMGLPPLTACVLSPSPLLRLQSSLQGVGPKLRALPRPNALRFSFSGTPQRSRLGWACILCLSHPSSSDSEKLDKHTLPGCSAPYSLCGPSLFPVCWSGVSFVSSNDLISGCKPPGGCQPSRISGNLWLETGKPVCSLVGNVISAAMFAPSPPPCLLPSVGDGPVCSQLALLWYSLSPLFWEQAG